MKSGMRVLLSPRRIGAGRLPGIGRTPYIAAESFPIFRRLVRMTAIAHSGSPSEISSSRSVAGRSIVFA